MKTTKTTKNGVESTPMLIENDFFERAWKESWTYIKTVVDVVHEPVLILDKEFRVMAANESFYRMFKVDPKDTENKIIYELGNGQWNIPALKNLLEDILPKNTFFNGFEVSYKFPSIGRKVMILNARRIYRENNDSKSFPPIILLAMEDVTEMMDVAKKLADHTNHFEAELTERTQKMEIHIVKLEKEINGFKINGLKINEAVKL
jgi:PAS domain-containing protein